MRLTRTVRRWVTAQISDAAVACAPLLDPDVVDVAEAALAWCGPRMPVVSRNVAENMRAVGLYTPDRHREYFRQAAGHLTGWMHVFRHGGARASGSARPMPAELARVVEQRVQLDDSVELLKEAASEGKGVVVMSMHIATVPLVLARVNQVVPTTVLARYSKDARRRRIKAQWWRATAIGHVALSSQPGQRGSRLAKMAEVLAEGRAIMIAVDMARKRTEGQPVRLFDRQVHLPSGAAVLSVMTGAPLMMVSAKAAGRANCLTFRGPFTGQVKGRSRASKEAAVAERVQWFADGLEAFLRAHAPSWFFWGDKRWTRVFHDDPRYVRVLDAPADGRTTASPSQGEG